MERSQFLDTMYEPPAFRIARWDAASLRTEAAATASGADRMSAAEVNHPEECNMLRSSPSSEHLKGS